MTDGAGTATTHWAVLIGINFYVGDKCLQGSVRDVEIAKQYLEAGPTPVDIAMLTATTPSDPGSRRPIEEPHLWPTHNNVIAGLKRVLEKAKQGDSVYIHYSGHGTRIIGDKERTYQSGNLAFVLFEDNEHGCSYLRGPDLAKCLRKMVARGLLVTFVLDCCYSDVGIRTLDYKPFLGMPLEQWLVNPNGAWELQIDGGGRRGALTYFLIEALSALRKSGAELTHQSLYQHLRTRFHASWPQQTPMRYGDKNFSFFGKLGVVSNTPFVSVYRTNDDRLCLSAGEAHGVYKGDEYAAYPFNTSEGVIDTVRCLTSDLIKTGWKAKPVTYFSPRKTSEAAEQYRFLHLCAEDDAEPCIFNVILNKDNECEILDGTLEKIISLPTIPLDTPRASDVIMDVLQHLATFNRSFESSFSLLPLSGTGASGAFENFGDKPLYLAVFNFTPSWKIVNLVSGSGGGDFMVVQPRDEEKNGKETIQLQMEVPMPLQDRGEMHCEDIVKVFITNKPTSFPSMVLPEIPLRCKEVCGRVRGGGGDQLSKFLSELTTLEDYPSGYPRFSALIASHDSFHICRRFSNLRTRLLLIKQDKLSLLEKQLEKLDREEVTPLSLGSSRRDTNKERSSVLSEIDKALVDYDTLIERNRQILSLEAASSRDVVNLQNWVDGNGCIAREETMYLKQGEDLLSVASPNENAVIWLGSLIEKGWVYFHEHFGQHTRLDVSRDPNVHIFPLSSTVRAARILITPFIVLLLLVPVIICNFVEDLAARLVIIITATASFIAVLSGLTKARTAELAVAGATYTTVLIVFISNQNAPGNG
ncbi:caspase domain-containing protein [Rostrohypoxylon terebratum]|nr:caspase domain-containing protein [Rostrohypoxylon terebratum]